MYTLPDLPYDKNSLEKAIDAPTMEIHHDKHHAGYVDKLNAALESYPDLMAEDIADLVVGIQTLPAEIQMAVRNNGGGHWNHSLFWEIMSPTASSPEGVLQKALQEGFSNVDSFQEQFAAAAAGQFGSGWAWLIVNDRGNLEIVTTPNQDNPLMKGIVKTNGQPILGVDVWEHAYYLRYQNKRADYLTAWWRVVNWPEVAARYAKAISRV